MHWGSGGARSWGQSCHPADQVLLLGWLVPTRRGAEQGHAGRGCCCAGTALLVTVPHASATHIQVLQCMARSGLGTEASCYPSRPTRSGCSGGTGITAIPAVRTPQAPHSSPQADQQPTGHVQPPASLEMALARGRALPGYQLLLAVCTHPVAIITSSSLAEKPNCFIRKEISQVFEQWQKCLQPASFQARRLLRIKQVSGKVSGHSQAWGPAGWHVRVLEVVWVWIVMGYAGMALQRGIQLPCSSCSCNHPGVQTLAQHHGGYVLSSHAEPLQG